MLALVRAKKKKGQGMLALVQPTIKVGPYVDRPGNENPVGSG